MRYRSQSATHSAIHINVEPAQEIQAQQWEVPEYWKMKVTFQNYSTDIQKTCKPLFRMGQPTDNVLVCEKKRATDLDKWLKINFPVQSAHATEDTMREYWNRNGKSFNWSELPTELKEHVLQFCVCNPHGYSPYWYTVQAFKERNYRKPGPFEVVDQLGNWRAVLRVSRQVRTLALRLLLVRNDQYDGGLTVVSRSPRELKDAMYRLGKYYQMTQNDSLPVDRRTDYLAKKYLHYPKQYPHLGRYATMRHGIRKLFLQFDFMGSLHFFKVSVGKFNLYRPERFICCDIFERLPNLDGLHIALPMEWWKDREMQIGPRLMHHTVACPRTLHRFIYERAAKALAPYRDVRMHGFIDQYEEQRFWDWYENAVLALQFTSADLDELYAECYGGIQLDVYSEIETEVSSETDMTIRPKKFVYGEIDEDIFPPRCECAIPCHLAFDNVGKY